MGIKQLVDRGAELNKLIKKMEAELDDVKKQVKAYAKKNKILVVNGHKHVATVSPSTFSKVEPKELFKLCDDLGIQDKRFSLVKVKITEAKKLLGESQFEEIDVPVTLKYHKCSFK